MTKLTKKVKNLKTPKRSGNTLSSSWTVPAECKKNNAKDDVRFDGLDIEWLAYIAKADGNGHQTVKVGKVNAISSDSTGKESTHTDSQNIPRSKYYPNTGKPLLKSASIRVRGYNTQGGKRENGEWSEKTLSFEKPAKPKSVSLTFDGTNGKVTPKYESAHPDGKKEVYDTQVWVTAGKQKLYDGTHYTDAEKTLSAVEVTGSRTLTFGKYIKVQMRAVNRGLAGNSSSKEGSTYICCPNPPSVGEAKIIWATQGDTSTAQVLVPIKPNAPKNDKGNLIYPTTIKLYALTDSSTDNDAASAATSEGWTEVATDDGNTEGLLVPYTNVDSVPGKYTWFLAVAERDGYTVPGDPKQAKKLNVTESSTVAGAASIEVSSGNDGHSVIASLSGMEENDDGYEVSWSTDLDAWESTEPPETFDTAGSTLVVKGLEENTRYYFKARAFDLDSEGNQIYGDYSGVVDATPVSTPNVVALSAPNVVERGKSIPFTWTHDTEAQQTEAFLEVSGGSTFSIEGSAGAYDMSPDEYGSATSVTCKVYVTTGGGLAESNAMTVEIADPPTCSLTNPLTTLQAQGPTFTVASDMGDMVRVAVYSHGSTGTGLHGDREQFDGDTVYSGMFDSAFSGTPRSCTITLPSDIDFHRGADYTITVVAIDNSTGLESQPASADFTVSWTHTAQQPTGTAVVDQAQKSVTVTVSAPSDAVSGDTFDLYRVTPDGERKIASGLPFGSSVKDRFAPYTSDGQGLHYIAVDRTVDGDTCESGEIPYVLKGKCLRFDWGGASIELPYNLKLLDTFAKDSEVRKHMDGTSQAYWNEGATRNASFDTDLIRFKDAEQQKLLRDMFQYAGSVFVRTHTGLAFCADVQPGQIERTATSGAIAVSISAVEHDLTDEGMPTEADITRPS